MNKRVLGQLIRRERLRRQWSQEGLCSGICAVSYLSKIEQGKTDANPEITALLMDRLGAEWHPEAAAQAKLCCDNCYDAIFSHDRTALQASLQELYDQWDLYLNSPSMMDALVIRSWDSHEIDPLLFELEPEGIQKTLLLILQDRAEEATRYDSSPFVFFCAGVSRYESGNYPAAIELLQKAYELAARDGYIYIMLYSRLFLGNCYSNLLDYDTMLGHYRIAGHIADALKDEASAEIIRYNTATTQLELGKTAEALDGLRQLRKPSALAWHKMSICYEKADNREEAFRCLREAEHNACDEIHAELISRMCELVRYRLEHPDYLNKSEYGTMLLSLFSEMRTSLPHGYAVFHLPWVLEWYKSSRQYRLAFELLSDFPSMPQFHSLRFKHRM